MFIHVYFLFLYTLTIYLLYTYLHRRCRELDDVALYVSLHSLFCLLIDSNILLDQSVYQTIKNKDLTFNKLQHK